jgi:hypothetical protein
MEHSHCGSLREHGKYLAVAGGAKKTVGTVDK